MALPTGSSIESLTYTHADLRRNYFHLDALLDRTAPVFSINDPTPHIRELGTLTVLPAELLLEILEDLSIIDLMRFRRCNRSSAYFVDRIPPLRTTLRIAPNTVKGMMALKVSIHITARQLCRKLYQRECDACGRLAQCIYLPTCLRACFACMDPRQRYIFNTPKTEDELVMGFDFRVEELAARPSFLPLLGTFTNGKNKFKMVERHTMYDCPSDKLNEKLGWSPWLNGRGRPRRTSLQEERDRRNRHMFRPDPNREAVTVVRDPLCWILLKRMACVIAPWPNSTATKAEEGVFCSVCLGTSNEDSIYTKEAYSEHLRDCRVRPHLAGIIISRDPVLWLCEDDE